jgi:starch phosphorylase
MTAGDYYMHLADLRSYLEADRALLDRYSRPAAWWRSVIMNIGHSGRFSSDRTIAEYAREIWGVEPCPIP